MKTRKILSTILIVLLITTILPMSAFAETKGSIKPAALNPGDPTTTEGVTGGRISYAASAISVVITGCENAVTAVNIPQTIGGKPVVAIWSGAFRGCNNLKSVTIPTSVTEIWVEAFKDCSSLTSIAVPNGVAAIENRTFAGCSSLESIVIPGSVKSIGQAAFDDCKKLASISIPQGVSTINNDTFSGCTDLSSVTIPNSVTSIGVNAFAYCENLEKITLPSSVKSIGNWAFYHCTKLKSVAFPEGITNIGIATFECCENLSDFTIPNSVKTISDSAFRATGLKTITIPASVTSIEESAFERCDNLTSIKVTSGNANYSDIDGVLFNNAKTTLIQFPQKKVQLSYQVPASVKTVGKGAFKECTELTRIVLPNGVTSIETWAFWCEGSKLLSITIPNSVTTIASNAFSYGGYNSYAYGFIICGNSGSYIESYANANGIPFRDLSLLPKPTITTKLEKATYPIDAKGKQLYVEADGENISYQWYKNTANSATGGTAINGATEFYYNLNTTTIGRTFYYVEVTNPAGITKSNVAEITVTPKQVLGFAAKAKKNGMNLSWNKRTEATGYQVVYTTDKSFKKGKKTVTITKNSTIKKTINKLPKGKKYYVKVCAYKTVGKTKILGPYSITKSVKIK